MRYRELGKTGLMVSEIGLGGEWLERHNTEEVREVIETCEKEGINILDCWMSEPNVRSNIGLAIKGRREKWIIQGHIGSTWENGQYVRTRDLTKVKPAFEDLLTRLQTDYIDLGMIHFIDTAEEFDRVIGGEFMEEIEELIAGGSIRKKIREELTYRNLDADFDNLWSILFTTGYLTQRGVQEDGLTELVIPNREICWIFVEQIQEWFRQETKRDTGRLDSFCRAFEQNDVSAIEEGFTAYLRKTISIRDTSVRKERKEHFYHGILLGLFGNMNHWNVMSNAEAGEGYCDIAVEIDNLETGIMIELKYAEDAAFEESCQAALRQIRDRKYEEILIRDGMKTIYRYGIACYKKRCRVVCG